MNSPLVPPLSFESRLLEKISSKRRKRHRKFQSRFLRLDLKRQACLLNFLGVLYLAKHKSKPHLYFGTLEPIVEELVSHIGGLCAYSEYIPEHIEREDNNQLVFEFISLSITRQNDIISLTEYLVTAGASGWQFIEDALEEARNDILQTVNP